jgi:hypothetical protein
MVPCYADALDADTGDQSDDKNVTVPVLVTSGKAWRQEMQKWMESEQDDDDEEYEQPSGQNQKPWLPATLSVLFGGAMKRPLEQQRR